MRMVRVPAGSMKNTILPGDHLVIHRSFGQIDRGEVVVYQHPDDSTYYIARVIGLPGETIQVRERTVYLNGHPLEEQRVIAIEHDPDDPLEVVAIEGNGPRVFYDEHVSASGEFGTHTPFQIPSDSFFVMGDNRDNSEDSRYKGPVPRKLIWGTASIVYYSQAMSPGGEIRWERIFKTVP